jgi:hypothetical protein
VPVPPPPPPSVLDVWQCADCNFDNAGAVATCHVCYAPRPAGGASPVSAEQWAVDRFLKQQQEQAQRSVLLEGLEPGERRHDKMGLWERMVHGSPRGHGGDRPVYWHRGGTQAAGPWLFYARSSGEWYVGTDEEAMQAGEAEGVMCVTSGAMLPGEIAEGAVWRVYDGAAWHDAPRVRAGPCTAAQAQVWERAREEATERMQQRARGAGAVMLEGQRPGERRYDCMGVWQLMADGRLTGDRPVYWHGGGTEAAGPWLYYASSDGQWYVGTDEEAMQAGWVGGVMCVTSDAMLPGEIAKGAWWRAYDGAVWHDAPRVRAGPCTAAQAQAWEAQAQEAAERAFPAAGSSEEEAVLQRLAAGTDSAAGGGGEAGVAAAALHRQRLEQLEVGGALGRLAAGSLTALQAVRALVLERLRSVRARFPAASEDDLCEALVCYSPESWLYAKGHRGTGAAGGGVAPQSDKYQGELHYGSDQAFHNGSAAVLGAEISDGDAMGAIALEVLVQGEASDRYNLWYFRFCAAAEQADYDEKGELRPDKGKLDEGHGGMRLADFTRAVNALLERHGSGNRVTDARVLALRLYTASTFKRLNTALRDKGTGRTQGELGFKACVQSARKCLLDMQAIPRPHANTFRGITGYLADDFESKGMGMDYAFFSASTDEAVAVGFAAEASVDRTVLFEIECLRACPGVDVSLLSVYPGEKEVLFAPCTGLSLVPADGASGSGARTGAAAGHCSVKVYPAAAQ